MLDPAGSLSASAASTLLEECSMLVTLPLLAPPLLAKDLDENMLEKWGVARYRRVNSAALAHRAVVNEMYSSLSAGASAAPGASSAAAAAAGASPLAAAPAPLPVAGSKESLHRLCAVVVDSGYSFTHIMPVYQGRTIKAACKRSVPARTRARPLGRARESRTARLDAFAAQSRVASNSRSAWLHRGRACAEFFVSLVRAFPLSPFSFPGQSERGRQVAHQLPQGDDFVPVSAGANTGAPLTVLAALLAHGTRCWVRSPAFPRCIHAHSSISCALPLPLLTSPSPSAAASAWNMMDETWIINDVKEKLCYVSTDFERELQAAKRSRKVAEKIRREYVLPNGSTVLEGYVKVCTVQRLHGCACACGSIFSFLFRGCSSLPLPLSPLLRFLLSHSPPFSPPRRLPCLR